MGVFDDLWDTGLSTRGHLHLITRRDQPTRVEIGGEATGELSLLSITKVHGLGTVVVVHEAGHHYFAGRGDRCYGGAIIRNLLVAAAGPTGPDGRTFRFVQLGTAPFATRDRSASTGRVAAKMFELETVLR